MVKMIQNLQK